MRADSSLQDLINQLPPRLQKYVGFDVGPNGLHGDLINANLFVSSLAWPKDPNDINAQDKLRENLRQVRTFEQYYRGIAERSNKRAKQANEAEIDPQILAQTYSSYAQPGAVEAFNDIVKQLRALADNPDISLVISESQRLLRELEKLVRGNQAQ